MRVFCFVFVLLAVFVPTRAAAQAGARGPGVVGGANGAAEAAVYYERGRAAMSLDDWYAAAEAFIECLRLNPAHAEGTAALA